MGGRLALSSPSPTTTAFRSSYSSPTRTTPTWLNLRHVTAPALTSRAAYAVARTPGFATSPYSIQCAANQVWLELATKDLLTFFNRLCLDGEARRWEPKRLRRRLLHIAGQVARSGRCVFVRL